MYIVQISFLPGHSTIQTTMVYLDITTEQEFKALATLEDENAKNTPKKWKANRNNLAAFCGVNQIKISILSEPFCDNAFIYQDYNKNGSDNGHRMHTNYRFP